MKTFIVLCFFLHHAKAFQYQPGCICSPELSLPPSNEQRDIYDGAIPWSVAQVGVWVPHGQEASLMELSLSFTGYPNTEMYDVMQVYGDYITVSGRRPEGVKFPITINSSIHINEGWANFQIKVDKNLSLWVWNSTQYELLSIKPMPGAVRSIDIRGSNLTMECHTGKKLWWIDNASKVIPLFQSRRIYEIQMYSSDKFDPILTLENTTTHLSWDDDKGILHGGTEPLPQNNYHNLTLNCQPGHVKELVICIVKSNSGVELLNTTMDTFPDHLTIGKGTLTPFFVSVTYNGSTELMALEAASSSSSTVTISAVVITAVTVLLLLLILGTLISLGRHMARVRKRIEEDMENRDERESIPLFNLNIPQLTQINSRSNFNLFRRQISRSVIQENVEPNENLEDLITLEDQSKLWKAVVCVNISEIKEILQKSSVDPSAVPKGRELSSVILAHLSGNIEIVDALASNTTNDLILEVLKVYEESITKIFNLACQGHFRHEGGVEAVLKHYNLPGSIRNKEGLSLLHIAVRRKITDGEPLWDPEDIRCLIQSHGCYPNSVDHKGRTCLMALANNLVSLREEGSQDNIMQGTRHSGETNISVKLKAWIKLAGLLVDELGCDPNISDYNGVLPKDVAKDRGHAKIVKIFTKEKKSLEYKERKVLFEELLAVSEVGDCAAVQRLLLTGAPITMIGEEADPVMQAIKCHKRDAALLLLSAGAPIIVACLSTEMIQRKPAIYSAFLRREIRDRLQNEASTNMRVPTKIKEYVEVLCDQIIDSGSYTIIFNAYENERDIFIISVGLGFSTFCHLLGHQINIYFLPDDKHPIRQCQKYKQINTFKILCWYLNLNPLCITRDDRNIPQELKDELFESEISILNKKCTSENNSQATEILDYCNSLYHSHVLEEPSGSVLILLAELGLVTILNRIKNATLMELDTVVDAASGATMLHVAASCSNITMVTYLLYHGVSPLTTMNGNLTAAHMAGFLGYKDCLEYIIEASSGGIQAYQDSMWKCGNLDPIQAHLSYGKNVHRLHLLSVKDLSKVIKYSNDQIILKNVLELKFNNKMEITNEEGLLDYLKKEDKFISKIFYVKMIQDVERDLHEFCDLLSSEEQIFKGKLVSGINFPEKSFLMLSSTLDFFLELEISYDEMNHLIGIGSDEIITNFSSHEKDINKNINKNILNMFIIAAERALKKMQWKSVVLLPSYSKVKLPNETGISIYCIWTYNSECLLLCLTISPVLQVPQPKIEIDGLPKDMKYMIHQNKHIYLQNTSNGSWRYNLFPLESYLIHILPRKDKDALLLCNLLVKLISSCWWLPRNENERIGHSLEILPFVVQDLPSHSDIFSCLLEILACDEVDDTGDVIERTILILSKFTKTEKESKGNFLLPKFLSIQSIKAAEGITLFLCELQNRSQFSLYGQSFRIK
ncbi:unnamed protein product [Meganyctiphanes norvegica]|uniref:Uncharacterized protein n=1 Tax=Meganyctiphanes norvegica TaxID=48144 RepID=A0AAV2Q4J6_MEGNR